MEAYAFLRRSTIQLVLGISLWYACSGISCSWRQLQRGKYDGISGIDALKALE